MSRTQLDDTGALQSCCAAGGPTTGVELPPRLAIAAEEVQDEGRGACRARKEDREWGEEMPTSQSSDAGALSAAVLLEGSQGVLSCL
jgi:hypothetical protein